MLPDDGGCYVFQSIDTEPEICMLSVNYARGDHEVVPYNPMLKMTISYQTYLRTSRKQPSICGGEDSYGIQINHVEPRDAHYHWYKHSNKTQEITRYSMDGVVS